MPNTLSEENVARVLDRLPGMILKATGIKTATPLGLGFDRQDSGRMLGSEGLGTLIGAFMAEEWRHQPRHGRGVGPRVQ